MNHLLRTPRLHVGAGTTHGALTVFPLWVEAPSVHGLHWSGQQLSVSELAGGPSVGELAVRNRSSGPVVLLEGDLVEGGWQNRMIATSVLLAGGASYDLPARCVEQGRWNGTRTSLSPVVASPTACLRLAATAPTWSTRGMCGGGSTGSSSGSVGRRARPCSIICGVSLRP